MRPLTTLQFLFVLAVTLLLSFHAYAAIRAARETSARFQAAAAAANIDSAIDLKKKNIAETITFGLYEGATEHKNDLQALHDAANAASALEWRNLRIFFYLCGGSAVLALLLGQLSIRSDVFIATLLAQSAVMLVLGVFTPMLSFINERDLPVVGHVITEAQTKSIWHSATALFESGNAWVGLTIVAASMVLPTTKLVLLALVLANRALLVDGSSPRQDSVERKLAKLASMIGQFSFVDLFIAAVFLSIFALRSFEGSTARSEPGLYYFNTYCTVSLVAGILAWRAPRPRWQPPH